MIQQPQIPILAKNPSATAANTKVETNLKIFTAYFPHEKLQTFTTFITNIVSAP